MVNRLAVFKKTGFTDGRRRDAGRLCDDSSSAVQYTKQR